MAELTKYQRSIVKNYYANLDTALLQRLGEQVTDLYLAEGKKREKLWTSIVTSLTKLEVPKTRIDQIRQSDDARKLAALLQEVINQQMLAFTGKGLESNAEAISAGLSGQNTDKRRLRQMLQPRPPHPPH